MGPYVGILICCMVAVWYCCLIPMRQRYRSTVVRKRKIQKGIKKDMPVKMLNDYIGKECSITIMGELCGFKAVLLEVEENWIKVLCSFADPGKGQMTVSVLCVISSVAG